MLSFRTLLAAGLFALSAGAASAATYYADKVSNYTFGTCSNQKRCDHFQKTDDRYNPAHATGAQDGKLTSLGLGGSITVGFSQPSFAQGSVSAWDIAYGTPLQNARNGEAVHIFTLDSASNIVEDLGILSNQAVSALTATKAFSFLRLVDVTKSVFKTTTSFDGFDLDAISVSVAPVPLPAAGVLLLSGFGGFAALRRRKALR